VTLDGVSKIYRVYARPIDRLWEAVTRRPHHRAHRALDDVSFEVARGEGFGIIGENGAGKSTLLKILAGVTIASAGRATVHGTAASILELGGGFHPELTGRQNIVLSAALLGLSERDVRARTPEIIDFSELGGAIDDPVRTYSTGMAMRLAFGIAIQVQPDVLIVDEALSVGDGYFQRKCMRRIQAFLHAGGTLLLTSHAMYYVSAFCARALWLRDGRVAALGPAASVIHDYEAFLTAKSASAPEGPAPETEARLAGVPVRITRVTQGGVPAEREREPGEDGAFREGDPWWLEIACESADASLGLHVAVGIDRNDGVQAFACSTRDDGRAPLTGRTRYIVSLTVPSLPLVKGQFTAYVFLMDADGLQVFDRQILPGILEVIAPAYRAGLVSVAHHWNERVDERIVEPGDAVTAQSKVQNEDQNRSLSPHV
jgi:lipopolysaccharide transport system ATP-binding protein